MRERVVVRVPVLGHLGVGREWISGVDRFADPAPDKGLQVQRLFLRHAQRLLRACIEAAHAQVLILRLARGCQGQERKHSHC